MALSAAAFLIAAAAPIWIWPLPPGIAPPEIPGGNPIDAVKVALGRRLFYDADLSIDGTMACSTCHEQRHGFADGNRTHAGVHGDPGRRNVPGLANVAWRRTLTWGDPGVTSLEAQVAIPLTGATPVEMGMAGKETELARRIGKDACYRRLFRHAFPDRHGRIDQATVAMALANFQRTLISFDAPVDRGSAPPGGAVIFASKCAGCHAGRDFTDDRFHALRPAAAGDRGLGEITGRSNDDGRFRTPSLRNVAVTGPWLHDGSAATLSAAILAHSDIHTAQVPKLLSYLNGLTDETFLIDRRFSYPDNACQSKVP